jgi:choice-of-anchor B domain-containing protein
MALAAPGIAHPPEQHDSQRISYASPQQRLEELFDVRGFGIEARFASLACENGMAGPYECKNVDLESFVPLPALGGITGNDIWGWTDPQTGKEYAIVGTSNSTAFVDVSDPKSPAVLGFLPTAGAGATALWRDVKVFRNHAFIVSEIDDSGMQVFDLTRLRDESGIFSEDAFYDRLSNTHNIAINEETGFAYAVGNTGGIATLTTDPEPCESSSGEGGGLHMIDVNDPENPAIAGCAIVEAPFDPENNYVHDVQCVIYNGPDTEHTGDEICFGSNENAVVIYDVTDKANPKVLSETTYATAAYTHQGSLTSDQGHFFFGDELDEGVASSGGGGTVDNTTTYVMSVADLENPGSPLAHSHETRSIDHNMYVHEGRLYQSNYAAGLRIHEYDDASLAEGRIREVAYFDFLPGVDVNDFAGTWSNYPFYESGIVVVSAIEELQNGLLVLRPRLSGPAPAAGSDSLGPDGSGPAEVGGPVADGRGGACANRIAGSKTADRLVGSAASDRISGRGGRDRLRGKGGDDCLRGGGGKDRLAGGRGNDEIKPGGGRDRGLGGRGDDVINAVGGGADRVHCGSGDDVAVADKGTDAVARSCETVRLRT